MKAFISSTLLCSILALNTTAQSYNWGGTMPGDSSAIDLVINHNGQPNGLFAAGYYNGDVDFDLMSGATIMGPNDLHRHSFLARYDDQGALIWAKSLFGNGSCEIHAMELNDQSEMYVSGLTNGTIDFDPGPGVANFSAQSTSIFLAKYSDSGNFIWARVFEGTSWGQIWSMDASNMDNLVVTGEFKGTLDADPLASTANLNSQGDSDIFLIQIDSAGSFMNAISIGGSDRDVGAATAVAANGSIAIAGSFNGNMDFDPGAGTTTVNNAGFNDGFIASYDPNLNFQWVLPVTGQSANNIVDLDYHPLGNWFVASGNFFGTIDFEGAGGTITATATDQSDAFLARVELNGDISYVDLLSGTSNEYISDVHLTPTGETYATGTFDGSIDLDPGSQTASYTAIASLDMFIAHFDSNGMFEFGSSIGGPQLEISSSITFDGNDQILLAGTFEVLTNLATFGGTAPFSTNSSWDVDGFIASYNTGTVGISKEQKNIEVQVYPNPVANELIIAVENSDQNYSIQLFDLAGKLVRNNEGIDGPIARMQVSSLDSGIYLLKVVQGDNIFTQRVVKH